MNEALALLAEHDWYLHMLWQDGHGWGATVRDTLEGTCEHHATARGVTASDAIHSAMLRLADKAYDEPETTVSYAAPTTTAAQRGKELLASLGLGRTKPKFTLLKGRT